MLDALHRTDNKCWLHHVMYSRRCSDIAQISHGHGMLYLWHGPGHCYSDSGMAMATIIQLRHAAMMAMACCILSECACIMCAHDACTFHIIWKMTQRPTTGVILQIKQA